MIKAEDGSTLVSQPERRFNPKGGLAFLNHAFSDPKVIQIARDKGLTVEELIQEVETIVRTNIRENKAAIRRMKSRGELEEI